MANPALEEGAGFGEGMNRVLVLGKGGERVAFPACPSRSWLPGCGTSSWPLRPGPPRWSRVRRAPPERRRASLPARTPSTESMPTARDRLIRILSRMQESGERAVFLLSADASRQSAAEGERARPRTR